MLTAIILGILSGLDNLQVGSAFELMGLNPGRRWRLIVSFTFFETTMPLVGVLIGNQLNVTFKSIANWLGPCIMLTLGLYIILRELIEKKKPKRNIANQPWILILLPFFMSLDNLIAGVGLGTAGYPILSSALLVGICAGTMCFLGFIIGEKLRRFIPGNIEVISGIYLICMAVFWVVK